MFFFPEELLDLAAHISRDILEVPLFTTDTVIHDTVRQKFTTIRKIHRGKNIQCFYQNFKFSLIFYSRHFYVEICKTKF